MSTETKTGYELIGKAIASLIGLAIIAAKYYVAMHFIKKYW